MFALLLHAPWWLCLIASTVFGAVWGAIPGIFKAYLNVNEVITAIMFNWIGLYGCNTIMYGRGTGPMYNAKQSKTFAVTGDSIIPSKLFGWDMSETFGYKSCTIAIFLAIIIAILLYVVMNKTTFGYELKACGCNKNAARYAGINEKRSIIARDCGHYLRHYHLPLCVLAAVQEPYCHALHGQAQKAGGKSTGRGKAKRKGGAVRCF